MIILGVYYRLLHKVDRIWRRTSFDRFIIISDNLFILITTIFCQANQVGVSIILLKTIPHIHLFTGILVTRRIIWSGFWVEAANRVLTEPPAVWNPSWAPLQFPAWKLGNTNPTSGPIRVLIVFSWSGGGGGLVLTIWRQIGTACCRVFLPQDEPTIRIGDLCEIQLIHVHCIRCLARFITEGDFTLGGSEGRESSRRISSLPPPFVYQAGFLLPGRRAWSDCCDEWLLCHLRVMYVRGATENKFR